MTDILLIRHGENEYTRKGKLAGWTPGVHLNETGRAQAEALAERLAKAPIKAIYSSPLERALETARPLAKSLKLSIQKYEGIGEVRYGDWTGKSLKMLARTKLWKVVQRLPSAMAFPNGETLREVQGRAMAALEGIARKHPKDLVALFSHGDVIKLAVAYYLGMPLDTFQRIMISTGSITAIRVPPGGAPMILRVNEQPTIAGKK
ncbi:MAG: MSMEG_4193 family putative phosphomutase [Chloroflexi bacterium]|nr:MSMEG_4193 family putative phosphomutase [Chloroflexota bacterium]